MSIDRDTSTTVTLGNRTVSVPAGGLFDRYRMQTDLDDVARDPRVGGVEFFRDQPKVEVQSAIGPTFTPNFYYAMSSARLTMLAPTSALRDRLPAPLNPLEVVPGFGLASLILFRYDVADIDFYTEAAVGIAVKPPHHGPLGAIDLIAALKNNHLDSYVLSAAGEYGDRPGPGPRRLRLPEVGHRHRRRHHGAVGLRTGAQRLRGIDVELHAPTPRQKRHRSGTAVSSLTSYTHFDGGWHGTFNQTNALVSGTTLFPRDIDLHLGEGRVSDDLRSRARVARSCSMS